MRLNLFWLDGRFLYTDSLTNIFILQIDRWNWTGDIKNKLITVKQVCLSLVLEITERHISKRSRQKNLDYHNHRCNNKREVERTFDNF